MLPEKILQLIDYNGVFEEKQIAGRWRDEISGFLSSSSEDLLKGHVRLEVGLEQKPVLKLILKRSRLSPVLSLHRQMLQLTEQQQQVADMVLTKQYPFHLGLRVEAQSARREIYVYERDQVFTSHLARTLNMPPIPEALEVTAFGLDEDNGISAYFTRYRNPAVEAQLDSAVKALEKQLRIPIAAFVDDLWHHLRVRNGEWQAGKFALELRNPPISVIARVLSHFRPPYFGYLAPVTGYRSLIVTANTQTGGQGWYFTV
ncbi:MAG: hypothetical protein KAG82_05330 [Alcanivoracaceae bacterium]|nr:hypothetical protein [Alcanivoracaceae bacterium]